MTPFDTIIQDALKIIGSPTWAGAWTTIGVITSTILSIIALRKSSRQSMRTRLGIRSLKNRLRV